MKQLWKQGLSGGALKIIALVTMIIDHATYMFVDSVDFRELYLAGRGIGRLAFPIYCFLIVEGFYHTRNVKKYCFRLFLFALVSEVPFDLAFYGVPFYNGHENVFFTLFLGVVVMYLLQETRNASQERQNSWKILLLSVGYFTVFLAAFLVRADYGMLGLMMIVWFYLFHGKKGSVSIANITVNALMAQGVSIQLLGACSVIPIWFYNGKKGISLKYFFYIIYPLHLLIFYFIKNYMM